MSYLHIRTDRPSREWDTTLTGPTLCGAAPTTEDATWAQTRWPKTRAYVLCSTCSCRRSPKMKEVTP